MEYDIYRGVFNADLLSSSVPSGELGLPSIFRVNALPNRLVSFDKAIGEKDVDQWVHFFIHDYKFARFWRDPWRYLPILAKFNGVIAPDFSVFWDLPLYVQIQSIGKSRLIYSWLRDCGVTVIPCIRWGKRESYKYAFDGIESGGTVAVGTVGCMRNRQSRLLFEEGFREMIRVVRPKRVIVYGSVSSPVFSEAEAIGVEIVPFESETALVFKERSA